MDQLTLTIAGTDLPVRSAISEAGNVWFGLRKKGSKPGASMYGVPVAPLADTVPTTVQIEGVNIHLSPAADKNGVAKEGSFEYRGTADIPGLGLKSVTVVITDKADRWNVKATVRGQGGGNGSSRAPLDISDL